MYKSLNKLLFYSILKNSVSELFVFFFFILKFHLSVCNLYRVDSGYLAYSVKSSPGVYLCTFAGYKSRLHLKLIFPIFLFSLMTVDQQLLTNNMVIIK